jgi:hypothetical protein
VEQDLAKETNNLQLSVLFGNAAVQAAPAEHRCLRKTVTMHVHSNRLLEAKRLLKRQIAILEDAIASHSKEDRVLHLKAVPSLTHDSCKSFSLAQLQAQQCRLSKKTPSFSCS